MDTFKREKAKAKGAYTRSRTKLLMTMEGGQSTRAQVIERLDFFAGAFENVICADDNLGSFYENVGELDKLRIMSCEMDGLEADFNETEQIVKGYLERNGSEIAHGSRSTPTGQSSSEQQQLELEIIKQEAEFNRLAQDFERTYVEYQRGTQQKRRGEQHFSKEGVQEALVPQKEAGTAVLSSLSTNEIVTSTPFPPQTSVSEPVHPVVQPIHSQQQLPPRTETSVPFIPSNGVTSPTYSGMHTTPQPSFNLREAQYMTPGKNQPLNSTTDQLSVDSASLLKRVSVPKFSGNKKNYEAWKAAVYSCVDQARATPEYKLLRMRECLQGEALKVVENLGHSAAADEAAKTRLERKYGGARRALTLRVRGIGCLQAHKRRR